MSGAIDAGWTSGAGLTPPRRGLALASVLAAMSLVVLDAGMANVALPTLAQDLGAAPAQVVLVITAYQTALVMALLPAAALGERFGDRRVFRGGVALFIVASLLCALSPSLPWLVAARFLQGLGGAAVMALGVALMRLSVSSDRLGQVIGWNALTVALSAAAAPTLGALIVAQADWTWLFRVNLPVGAMALLAAAALPVRPVQATRLDGVSIALNGGVFALFVAGAEVLPSSPVPGGALIGGALLVLVILVRRERPKAAPLVPLDLLASRSFRLSALASVCCFTATAAALVALPFHLQQGLALPALQVGLYLSPWPLTVAATATLAGRLADRIGTTALCATGGAVLAVGLTGIALWPADDGPSAIAGLAAVCGFGFGLFQVPNNRNLFLAAPPERAGAAGGMQGTARLTGQTMGAMVMTTLFSMVPVAVAPRVAIAVGAALALAAGAISLLRASEQGPAAHD